MKEIDNTPIESFDQDWGDPDGTGKKAKSLEQVQAFLKKHMNNGYKYISTATPSTTPVTLTGDEKVFFIATEEGDYTSFGLGNISELSIIKSENGSWKTEGLGVPCDIQKQLSFINLNFDNKWEWNNDNEGSYGYRNIGQYTKPMDKDFMVSQVQVNDAKSNTSSGAEVQYNIYLVTGLSKPENRYAPKGKIDTSSTHKFIQSGTFHITTAYSNYKIDIDTPFVCPAGSQVVIYMSTATGNITLRGGQPGQSSVDNSTNDSNWALFCTSSEPFAEGASWSANNGYYSVALTLIQKGKVLSYNDLISINNALKSLGERIPLEVYKEYDDWYISGNKSYVDTNIYSDQYHLSMFKLHGGDDYLIEVVNSDYFNYSEIGIAALSDTEDLEKQTPVKVLVKFKEQDKKFIFINELTDKFLLIEHYPDTAKVYKLTMPAELLTQITQIIEDGIDRYIPEIKTVVAKELNPSIHIQIPDTVYAMVGLEMNIWNDTVAFSMDKGLMSPVNYHVEWSCPKGNVTSRGFRFTPTANDVGTYNNFTCKIYSVQNNILLDSKTFTVKVVDSTSLTQQKNILFCGDSLGSATAYYIQDNIAQFEGTKPNLIGNVSYKPILSQPPVYNLSYGGWSWKTFATAGVTKWRLQVSDITSLSVNAKYTDNSNGLFTIEEVNITDGSGNILVSKTYQKPYDYHDLALPTGTLTKVSSSYTGDDILQYTAEAEAGNPLWNDSTDAIDFGNYQEKYNLPFIDMVIFQLGINDNSMINNGDEMRTYIETLYNAYVNYNPNGVFVIGITPNSGNDYDGMGVNYGGQSDIWGQKYARNMEKIRDLYISMYESGDYPRLKIIAENLNIDRYYGYGFSERDISARYGGEGRKEKYHNNYVHPATSGYYQLADSITAGIVGILAES